MARDPYTGSTQAKTALLTNIQGDLIELFSIHDEVVNARHGEDNLLEYLDIIQSDISDVETEISNARDSKDTLIDQINDIQEDIDDLEIEVIAARGDETDIDTRIDVIDTQISTLSNYELPNQSGNSGKFLGTDGSTSSWITAPMELSNDLTPQLGAPLDTNSHMLQASKGADIASASALSLGSDGNYFGVTGTTTITSINTTGQIGTTIKLCFADALTLTHHATDLILPDSQDIITEAGYIAEFVEYASGKFVLTTSNKTSYKNFLYSVVASGDSSILFESEFTDKYRKYYIESDDLYVSTATSIYIRVGTGATPTYQTTNYSYRTEERLSSSNGTTVDYVSTTISQIGLDNIGESGSGNRLSFDISKPAESEKSIIDGSLITTTTSADTIVRKKDFYGCWHGSTAITAVQLYVATGTLTGTVNLYGVK